MAANEIDEHWNFYSCEIEGMPHSTMVNLSLFEVAPLPDLTNFCALEVTLKFPNPEHGMTTSEEVESLNKIEALIEQNETSQLKYVARQTGNGMRKYYFYANPEFDFRVFVHRFAQDFPDYEKSSFSFEDGDWQTYFDDLYPNAMAMNEISNRSVFIRLEESGDSLDTPRTIDHSVVFNNRRQAKKFSRLVEAKGFIVEMNSSGILNKTYDLLVQREDAPSSLDPITFDLLQMAESLGGSYDGWGCLVAKN